MDKVMSQHGSRAAAMAVALLGVLWISATGCEGERVQSMLHPASDEAAQIAKLWWVMLGVYGGVFVATMAVLAVALQAKRTARAPLGNRFIAITGIGIPLLILMGMLIYPITLMAALGPREGVLTIRVTGHQWWWHVEYPEQGIVTANELHIPVNRPVRLELISGDVVHSFWVPQLGRKMDMLPEHERVMWIEADRAGVYRGQCAEYCGTQHARMAFYVEAMEEEDFGRWVSERQAAAERATETPVDADLERSRELFTAAGCGACHGITGVSVAEQVGPDLTHMGTRLSIGAGTMANTEWLLRGWIVDPHRYKPGNLMPPTHADPDDLDALVEYLMSLE
jgi:cytochrome c oxidase subunit II